MIDEKKLAIAREVLRDSTKENLPASTQVFLRRWAPQLLDTLSALWKENAELKEEKEDLNDLLEPYEKLGMKQLEQIKKLEAVARAAKKVSDSRRYRMAVNPHVAVELALMNDELESTLAALEEKPSDSRTKTEMDFDTRQDLESDWQ